MARFFHVKEAEAASHVIQNGFRHGEYVETEYPGSFFASNPWTNKLNMLHLVGALPSSLREEWYANHQRDDGTWLKNTWQKLHGDEWTLIFVGEPDIVYPCYGDTILEFLPPPDAVYGFHGWSAFVCFSRPIPASCFRLVGKIRKDLSEDTGGRIDEGTAMTLDKVLERSN